MTVSALCKLAGISCPSTGFDKPVTDLVTDVRNVKQGSLYFAICGFHYNGEKDIEKAIRKGASAVISEHLPNAEFSDCCLCVGNAREAMARLYHAWYRCPGDNMKLIGITGTNGKTSVACMVEAILRCAGYRVGRIGTLGAYCNGKLLDILPENPLAHMTTPDPAELYRILYELRDACCDYVVMEVSSHSLALGKVAPLQFDVGIFTNLTPEHLDFHHTMNGYLEAKCKLFAQCKCAVINGEDAFRQQIQNACTGTVLTCGYENGEYRALNRVTSGVEGVSYQLHTPTEEFGIQCPVPGNFTVMNTMQAAVCTHRLGIPSETIAKALAEFCGVSGRMEQITPDGANFRVFIDYAHTPDALEKLLRTVREFKDPSIGKLTVLFGCGGDRDREKRKEMGAIASKLADFVIITSDNSRSEDPVDIIRQILRGVNREKEHIAITNRRDAIHYAVENASLGDILVLAGKGHETYEIDRMGTHHFDERKIVQSAYRKRMS